MKFLSWAVLGVFVSSALFFSMEARAVDKSAVSPQRIVHEAENLSLNKDRLLACGMLWRNLKKADKSDAKVLREKLLQLSRYYYTDKGFQAFLVGKELFQKQKYQDALDKFLEADDAEAGNVEVLHYLTLTQLWLLKSAQAEATNKRALQMCPIDVEIQRDALAVEVNQEMWGDAVETAVNLSKEYGDSESQTLQFWGVALLKTEHSDESKKVLEQAVQKEPKSPEPYYWLATAKGGPDAVKLLTKYVELCKNKGVQILPGQILSQGLNLARDVNLCGHVQDAEKKMNL